MKPSIFTRLTRPTSFLGLRHALYLDLPASDSNKGHRPPCSPPKMIVQWAIFKKQ